MDCLLFVDWQVVFGYIGLMLVVIFLLWGVVLVFNVFQVKLFVWLFKDIVYCICLCLIECFWYIVLGEYEIFGGGLISVYLVIDLDILDKFVGEIFSCFLVVLLMLFGIVVILVWMYWQLVLLILLFNLLVIWFMVQLGKCVKYFKKFENDSIVCFIQVFIEIFEVIQEVCVGNCQGYFFGCFGYCVQEVCDYVVVL